MFSIYLGGNRRWVSLERLAQSCETSQLHEKVISVTGHYGVCRLRKPGKKPFFLVLQNEYSVRLETVGT